MSQQNLAVYIHDHIAGSVAARGHVLGSLDEFGGGAARGPTPLVANPAVVHFPFCSASSALPTVWKSEDQPLFRRTRWAKDMRCRPRSDSRLSTMARRTYPSTANPTPSSPTYTAGKDHSGNDIVGPACVELGLDS